MTDPVPDAPPSPAGPTGLDVRPRSGHAAAEMHEVEEVAVDG